MDNISELSEALQQASRKLGSTEEEVITRLLAADCRTDTSSTSELSSKCPLALWYSREVEQFLLDGEKVEVSLKCAVIWGHIDRDGNRSTSGQSGAVAVHELSPAELAVRRKFDRMGFPELRK